MGSGVEGILGWKHSMNQGRVIGMQVTGCKAVCISTLGAEDVSTCIDLCVEEDWRVVEHWKESVDVDGSQEGQFDVELYSEPYSIDSSKPLKISELNSCLI